MDLISIAIFLISLDFLKKKNTLESSKNKSQKTLPFSNKFLPLPKKDDAY